MADFFVPLATTAQHAAPVVKHIVHHAAAPITQGTNMIMTYIELALAFLGGGVVGWFVKQYFGAASTDVTSLLKQIQNVLPTTSTPATPTTPAQIHVSVPASTPVVTPAQSS